MRTRRRPFPAVLIVIIILLAVPLTVPWAFHIGGRWTPLLNWSGSGKLITKSGTYPLYVSFFPSPHFSRLRLDGLRPTGGLQGTGVLYRSPGVAQQLKLSGTIYGAWRSTEDSVMQFRLLEWQILQTHQVRGYFDLYGRWQGPELVMDDRGAWGSVFRSGLKIEHASVTLAWVPYLSFEGVGASAPNSPARR
jgi:hypothetical protein